MRVTRISSPPGDDPAPGEGRPRIEVLRFADCAEAALEFRNANRAAARDSAYLAWRYLSRPAAGDARVIWLSSNGVRLAAATVAPHDVFVRGGARRIGIVGDISVAAAARGRGMARTLLESVAARGVDDLDGLLVMPNPPLFTALRAAGWHEAAGLARHVRHLRGAATAARGSGAPAVPLARRALGVALAVWGGLHRVRVAAQFRLEPSNAIPPGLEQLWRRVAGESAVCCSRDTAYLEWRYLRHPIHRYTPLALMAHDELRGYAMTRLVADELWIDDWLVDSEAAGAALGALLVEWARRTSVATTLQTRTGSVSTVPWRRLGFLRRSDSQSVFVTGAWEHDARAHFGAGHFTPGDKDV